MQTETEKPVEICAKFSSVSEMTTSDAVTTEGTAGVTATTVATGTTELTGATATEKRHHRDSHSPLILLILTKTALRC